MSARGSTLTIRDVPARVVKSLKRLASRQNKSMEQQVRDILEQHLAERDSVLKQIEASWARQSRRPESNEIDAWIDRKSTRLNSSHLVISYAVFCLKKKK